MPDDIPNLGPVSRAWLAQVGVHTLQDIRRLGVIVVFRKVQQLPHATPTANLLYALEAALTDTHWTLIPPKRREELRNAARIDRKSVRH